MVLLLFTLLASHSGMWWTFTFSAHPDNSTVIAVTTCQGSTAEDKYFAYDRRDIEPGETRIEMVYQPTPKGKQCAVVVTLMRGKDNGEKEPEEYVAESIILTQQR